MKNEEKLLLLGALFHDIGKFAQRCTGEKTKHEELGFRLVTKFEEDFTKILGNKEAFLKMREIVSNHHNRNSKDLFVNTTQKADYLSASERVEFDEPDADLKDKWSHKFLTSLFSKIYLNNAKDKNIRYYEQKELTQKNHEILIPKYDSEKDIIQSGKRYNSSDFDAFETNLKSILSFYNSENDFYYLINLILILFEKYMWSVPDFTGSEQTDISLFNHSKDVAGFAHSIYKSELSNSTKLNLIIGDLPGIQKYIFNVTNKKPAKILRGRSIYVQILTRQFASIMLKELDLTEANLIMIAGGKFYIISDNSSDFEENYKKAKNKIEEYLIKNFDYQLSFSSAFETFEYNLLKEKDKEKRIYFGDIIDKASFKLLEKRNQQFESKLFNVENFDENNFVLNYDFIKPDVEADSDKIKCSVTGFPIKKGRKRNIEGEQVDKQVENEYKIGEKVTKSNVVIKFTQDYSEVIEVLSLNEFKRNDDSVKLILNPNLDELLEPNNLHKDVLRNSLIIEVANYATRDSKNPNLVMDFEDMEKSNNGAKFMTLIKGDVDNLGLIMSSGLVGNRENETAETRDLTGISRTTTLSNHLKYFFSYSLNGFLEEWEKGTIAKSVDDGTISDQKVYTVFAGGDDIMLIAPQNSALKLVNAFNETFQKFVCHNPEVHISYSLTNFKHNTPIRIVADMAEENQKEVKKLKADNIISDIDENSKIFYSHNDKDGLRLFETNLKNESANIIAKEMKMLVNSVGQKHISLALIQNLLEFSKMMQKFRNSGDTSNILWHPHLSYLLDRNVKIKGNYPNKELEIFFRALLKVNKTEIEKKDENIIYPLICNTIYSLRK